MSMYSLLFRALSPGGTLGQLSIFIFHRVLRDLDPMLPYEPSAEQFDWMVRFLVRSFNVMPLGDAVRHFMDGTLPAAAAAITFDDGYADNLEVAWPILEKYGCPATFFIATSFLDGGKMWNDEVIDAVRYAPDGEMDLRELGLGSYVLGDTVSRIRCYENLLGRLKYLKHDQRSELAHEVGRIGDVPKQNFLMMTRDQVRRLYSSGAEIGAHTHTHPILELLDDDKAILEIETSKLDLQSIIGEPVTVFAYPNGVPGRDCSARHGEMVKKLGFEAAVSTEQKFADSTANPFFLPRFTPWDRTERRFSARCLQRMWINRP